MSFSGAIDTALVGKLTADAPLMALMTDGVYWDLSAHGKTKVVIVKLMSSAIEPMFGGRAYETPVYLVKAVELSTSMAHTEAAAARIDAILDGGSLTIPGYTLMAMQLEEHVHYTEEDPANVDARWQHHGGLYSVWASP